jgi:membrane protein implicated in regulation of membrane protease activity
MILVGAILLALFVVPAPWGLVLVAGGVAVEIGEAAFWVWLSKRRRPQVGAEALIGAEALVVTPCRPFGQVRVQGELWQARCDEGADRGETVHVSGLTGLVLVVERA